MIVIPDEGKIWLADYLLSDPAPDTDPLVCRLFKTNTPLLAETVRSDLVEANYSGYLPIDLTRAGWTDAAMVDGWAQKTWGTTFLQFIPSSGTQDIWGYFVTDPDDNFILWGEKRATAKTVSASNPFLLLPVMRLRAAV